MDENRREATCVSLFSGIGGLDHGLHRAGFRHLLLCESDPWRRSVLAARFPGVPIADDVRGVCQGAEGARPGGLRALGGSEHVAYSGRGWSRPENGHVDLVAGGSPCQDLSVAGQRRGLVDGDRSSLFFEMARVIDAVRPRWVLWENVPGAFSSQGGRDFGAVLGTLADLGYGLGWRTLDSRFFGVPQRRRRVFVVGALADRDPRAAAERAGKVLAVGSRCGRHPATRGEAREDVAVASLSGLGTGGPDDNDAQGGRLVAPALVKRYGKGTDSDATDTMVVAGTLKGQRGKGGGGIGPEETLIAETVRSHPRPGSNSNGNIVLAAPLTAGGHPNSNAPGRRKEDDENLVAVHEDYTFDWQAGGGGNDDSFRGKSRAWIDDKPGRARSLVKNKTLAVHTAASVRRLTRTECERLQALPDGWTNPAGDAPDSRRYAGLGDAVTASVGEWIGRRILASGG